MGRDSDGWTVGYVITLYHLQKLFRIHTMKREFHDWFSEYFFGRGWSVPRNIFVDTERSLLSFPTWLLFSQIQGK